ncbi:ABC transporter ATP-binding protein [Actinomyces sp. 186855]|nr:ABC transporter ATP-binding protein [Actinomyces sp. AC-20-1]MCL3789163.1 ABC transporter ATP-binding protein [Actinomyces sp. 187325]MCL3792457.1 ABC transporter ATP-binding protein [Actinomyces sp. 186855]MCL3794234.1 ABC transporter ATP-binding protein [Actinomyces sp. 217892]
MAEPTRPIEVSGLVKRFGRVTALNGLDLTLKSGTVHGFLGPNGAGKSTAIRTLLGLYRPDAGSVRVLGEDPATRAAGINRRLAYVPGDVALWPRLTGGQALDALAGLRGARDTAAEAELIERFDLDPSKRVRTYSKGNRQKVALIAALSAPVDLFVLDEPTSGLDPLMERVFTEVVAGLSARGATVLLSSHILAEVQAVCSRVTIIKEGRSVQDGDLATLQSLAHTRVSLGADADRVPDLLDALTAAGCAPGSVSRSDDGDRCRLVLQVASTLLPGVLAAVSAHGLVDVRVEPATLEDLFLSHYESPPAQRADAKEARP